MRLPSGNRASSRGRSSEIDRPTNCAMLRDDVVTWANKGRYTKVRFKFRGKQLLPDIPLAAFMAAQGLTFYWGGILRALVFNLAGKAVFDVEMINDSEKRLARGKEYLLS